MYAWMNEYGDWLELRSSAGLTGPENAVGFVTELNKATVMPHLPTWVTKEGPKLLRVRVVETRSVRLDFTFPGEE